MQNNNKNKENEKGGFIKIIILIVVALLLMRHFGITFTKILSYFHLTLAEVTGWFKAAWEWFKALFNSVK